MERDGGILTAVDFLRTRFKAFFEKDSLMANILPLAGNLDRAKFSRAKLLLKIAEDNRVDMEQAVNAALGVEMVHLATLVHDDVIDDADMRREQDSFRSKRGNKSAILYGDYLFSSAIDQIQQTQSSGCSKLFTERVKDTCRGESIQDLYLTEKESSPTLDLLHEVARGKTGALFAFCTEAPLWMNREFSEISRKCMGEIGFLSGLGYQLADDILDIGGTKANLGKSTCNDLLKNVMTTPLFMFMKELRLNWNTLRDSFFHRTDDFSNEFLESESFEKIKIQINDIRGLIEEKLEIVEKDGVVMREVVEIFWHRYVTQRMKQLSDSPVTV